jgi:hypothetical protein
MSKLPSWYTAGKQSSPKLPSWFTQGQAQEAPEYATDDLQNQIDNAKFRLEQSGGNPDPDSRNWFEKATNLPEDQNAFFDLLNLIDRPRQTLTNLASAKMGNDDNRSLGSAAIDGFAGRNQVHGRDLLEDSGVENKWAKNIGGFAIDVLGDPLTYTPASVFKLAGKGIGSGAKAVEGLLPAQVREGREQIQDGLSHIFNRDHGLDRVLKGADDGTSMQFDNQGNIVSGVEKSDQLLNIQRKALDDSRYFTDKILEDASTAAKTAGGLDKGTDVGRVMEGLTKQTDDIAQPPTRPKFVPKEKSLKGEYLEEIRNGIPPEKSSAWVENMNTIESATTGQPITLNGFRVDRGKPMEGTGTYYGINFGYVNKYAKERIVHNSNLRVDKITLSNPLVVSDIGGGAKYNAVLTLASKLPKNSPIKPLLLKQLNRLEKTDWEEGGVGILDRLLKKAGEEVGYDGIILKRKTFMSNTLNDSEVIMFKKMDDKVREIIPTPKPIVKPKSNPVDPNIQQAAETLTQSNTSIRTLASERGIDINNLENYMAHILTEESKKFLKESGRAVGSVTRPSAKVVGERRIKTAVEEANEIMRKEKGIDFDFFEPNAFFATAEGQRRVLNYVIGESVKKDILKNPLFARKIKKDDSFSLSKDEVIIRPDDYKFFRHDLEDGKTILGAKRGDAYVVTKGAKKVLDGLQNKFTDEGINAFVKTTDTILDTWKKFALFSAGFHLRNFIGNNFNMWIHGMRHDEIARYVGTAPADIQKAKNGTNIPAYEEFKRQGLIEGSVFENEFRFSPNPREALERSIKQKSGELRRTPFEASRDVGTKIDEYNRYALYKWARDKGKPKEEAATIVREVLFDYSDLSNAERAVGKRLMPFYTWMRKNSVFQIKNFLTQPAKYANVEKARQGALDVAEIEDESLPHWLRESFSFPVHGDGGGSGSMLGLNLPLSDLASMANPTRMLTDSLSPLIKTPIELGTNTDLFRGKPIKEFEGQTKRIGGETVGLDLPPELAHLVGQMGALRNLAGHAGRAEEGNWLDILTGNIRKDHDADKAEFFQVLQQLQEMQDEMKRYEQETGQRPPTIAELRQMGIMKPKEGDKDIFSFLSR